MIIKAFSKILLLRLITLVFYLIIFCSVSYSQVNSKHVYVNGYYRSNGTYVEGYYRTAPNSTTTDNFSTIGNINPYTGKAGWLIPENKPISYFNYSYPEQTTFLPYNDYTSTSINSQGDNINNTLNPTYYQIKDNNYFFYYQGKSVLTTNEWKDKDLIIYFDQYAYLIPRYYDQKNGSQNNLLSLATWKVIDGSYLLYFKEQDISKETSNIWSDNDLIVFYKNNAFRLKNYYLNNDGKIRIAQNLTTWKCDGKSLIVYVNGEQISNLTSKRLYGDDLLVEYNENVYILSNFKNENNYQTQISQQL
jgi:hypothetical protein